MSYYFVLNIKTNDKNEYQKYLNEVDDVFSKFNGKYLAVDDPKIIEGNWNYSSAVIIEFPSEKDFYKRYNSKEYQEILKFRLDASTSDSVLKEGK